MTRSKLTVLVNLLFYMGNKGVIETYTRELYRAEYAARETLDSLRRAVSTP